MFNEIQNELRNSIKNISDNCNIAGVIACNGDIYPLGSDTKVLSTVFELIARPFIHEVAKKYGYTVVEPKVQNHYPDFTLMKNEKDPHKIAVDIKTTYRKDNGKFSYTLGGYTSFIRDGNGTKNIVFPFSDYKEHWVIGFVYDRLTDKKAASHRIYSINDVEHIPLPYQNVDVFINHKWQIASDIAGSGNTTNIGSICSTIEDFINGNGKFASEDEFLDYWKNYGRTKKEREHLFNNVLEYRQWKKSQ